jgi:hypothetical protein
MHTALPPVLFVVSDVFRTPVRVIAGALALLSLSVVSACYTGLDTRASGEEGNGDDAPTAASCDPDEIDAGFRLGRRLSRAEYEFVIVDLFDVVPSARFPGPFGASQTGYSTEPALNVVGEVGVEDLMLAAEDIALVLPDRLPELLPCTAAGDTDCAREYLATIGRRAFRRTLTDSERDMLLAVYEAERADEATFAEAIAVMTAQMLQMPAFLYVMEAPAEDDEPHQLSSLEMASRLSFYLWNSIPDDELLDRAEDGDLHDAEAIAEEAQRMFDDPKARRGFSRFFREWTQVRELEVASKDITLFPELDEPLADAINDSFERYVTNAVRSGTTLPELLTQPRTIINAELADYYGVAAPDDDWESIDLPADRYAGLVTQPAVMAGLAHATETSYVFRGRFVRQRLLCEPALPPPGNAMTAFNELDKPEDPTARDLSELVQARSDCHACHVLIDPAGLALEHFDPIGRYRDSYPSGKSIETADVMNVDDDEIEFDGPIDLMEKIAVLPQVQDCFARQVFRYETARMETDDDACTIGQISDALAESEGRLDEAFLAVTRTDAFRYRRAD